MNIKGWYYRSLYSPNSGWHGPNSDEMYAVYRFLNGVEWKKLCTKRVKYRQQSKDTP